MWRDLGTWKIGSQYFAAFCSFDEKERPDYVRVVVADPAAAEPEGLGGVHIPYADFKALVCDWAGSIARIEREAGYPPRAGEAA